MSSSLVSVVVSINTSVYTYTFPLVWVQTVSLVCTAWLSRYRPLFEKKKWKKWEKYLQKYMKIRFWQVQSYFHKSKVKKSAKSMSSWQAHFSLFLHPYCHKYFMCLFQLQIVKGFSLSFSVKISVEIKITESAIQRIIIHTWALFDYVWMKNAFEIPALFCVNDTGSSPVIAS